MIKLTDNQPAAVLSRAEAHRDRMARRSREQTARVAEIGEIPPVQNPERRAACEKDLLKFLHDYFPESTGLGPLSEDHHRVVARIQRGVLGQDNERMVNALPRGFGKTTISENSAIWALLYGHRRFVPIFASDAGAAERIIESIQTELSENEELLADFPEVCFPIAKLEGVAQRCKSQTHNGMPTHIRWRKQQIVLPTIAGSVASGAILTAKGIEGASRGLKHKCADGTQQRPDFILVDDPQTDESASTPAQVEKRIGILLKNILKLGGHKKKIACVMNATVIRRGDLVEQILDPKKHPAWQGERVKMVKAWADKHDTLWLTEYAKLRNHYDGDTIGDQLRAHQAATDFYQCHRTEMDAGCVVSWEQCFDEETEISATQHAYNALIDDGLEVFAAEYQNEPIEEKVEDDELALHADFIAGRLNNIARGELPVNASKLVAYIDPKKDLLFWTVTGFAEGFGGWVADYGTFPDQKRAYFNSRNVRFGLQSMMKSDTWEAALYAGLDALVSQLASREWKRDDGAVVKVERILIDHGWGDATETIDLFCRQSTHAVLLAPTKGIYCGAKSRPFNDLPPKPGEARGPGWRMMPAAGKHAIRPIRFDANYWKTFVANRWKTPMGGRGCLSLFGSSSDAHKLFADHLVSEKPVVVMANGRRIVEWGEPQVGVDNDFLDCLVGCHVAASERGISLHEQIQTPQRFVSLSDMKKSAKHWDPKQKKWAAKVA